MDLQEKKSLLADMLRQIAPEGDTESLGEISDTEMFESIAADDQTLELASAGVEKVAHAREFDLNEDEIDSLEAIILPRQRPIIDINDDSFQTPPPPWQHLGSDTTKSAIEAAIPSVGRIELPNHNSIPYAGTGFVVGDDLLMTNRHVAELFAGGLGFRDLAFRPGQSSAVDFRCEVIPSDPILIHVTEILMIHPWWDMAIVRVQGLPQNQRALDLSVTEPAALAGQEIAVIGYPAQDFRNDIYLQNRIFRGIYNVKRMQPGKLRSVVSQRSFGHDVDAITHDSSTLGGNSGSAVVRVDNGEVVALHFSGRYLKANYAVPTYELARDPRVVDMGLNFKGTIPSTDQWDHAWRSSETGEPISIAVPALGDLAPDIRHAASAGANSVTWTIPIQISIAIGDAACADQPVTVGPPVSIAISEGDSEAVFKLKPDADYKNRNGYDPSFLGESVPVPLPLLTKDQFDNVAFNKLADRDKHVLPYHNFSLVMNKERRLAYFTAVNIDGKREKDISRSDFSDKWFVDPRIPERYQLQNDLYKKNKFDRGHLVRRLDPVWGRIKEARKAHDDTFHWTNCSPQHERFNRNRSTWGLVENWILENAHAKNQKVSVFTGPVFRSNDKTFTTEKGDRVQIPDQYWKIVVMIKHDGTLSATAYLLTQAELIADMVEAIPEEPKSFQTTIRNIETLTQYSFGDLRNHDTLSRRREEEGIESTEEQDVLLHSFEDLIL